MEIIRAMPVDLTADNAGTVSTEFEDSLVTKLKSTGLQCFEAEVEGKQPGFDLRISGGLEKFIEAVKAAQQSVVFYELTILDDEDFFVELGFFVEYDASERCVAVQFTREVRIMHEGLDLFALTAQIGRSFQSLRNDGETVRGKRAGFGVCAPA